ncbi:MAG: hypothetical protein LGB66_05290 [Sulfurovum sp.]|nr:hypothetical protein [Sulfurovum sp.]
MNYELAKYGIENSYDAGKNNYETETERIEAIQWEQEYFWIQHCIEEIEEFSLVVKNEDEYADYIAAKQAVIEYQEIFVQSENNYSEKIMETLAMQQSLILNLTKKLETIMKSMSPNKKEYLTVKELEEVYSIKSEK